MLAQPFLTDLDTRAQVKGSIDPLGAMAVWTRLGRRVVGNVTTVTTSVKDFKTLLLGFGLIKDLRRHAGPEGDVDDLAAFLRWEQLAAYARATSGDWGFRGFRRVRRQLRDPKDRNSVVPISAERDCQILGNQKVYGLWGLFTVPSRASGLLDKEVNELTAEGEAFVERTWKQSLTPIWNVLLETIGEDRRRFNLERRETDLKRLRTVWTKYADGERAFWARHLVQGGPADKTAGKQAILAKLLRDTLADPAYAFSQRTVRSLARQAAREDRQLADGLLDIAAAESVLVFAEALFGYLQTLDAQPTSSAISAVRRKWPKKLTAVDSGRFATLRHELERASGNVHAAVQWVDLSSDLAEGRWDDAIPRLLQINKLVMDGRGGAAWVADEGGTLRVRYRDEAASLPDARDLVGFPGNRYFIGSLRSIVQELEKA